jgi:DNA gyrase subunit A
VVSVARIDESDEEEIELDAGDEIDPMPDAIIGEDELSEPVDPAPEGPSDTAE